MSRRLGLAAFTLAPFAVLAACGDDPPDIAGLYETTEHLRNDMGCTGGDTPASSPPYFRIETDEVYGAPLHTRMDCTSTAEADCEPAGGLLTEETDEGWMGYYTYASGSPGACTLGYGLSEARLDGDTFGFETHVHEETGEFDPCEPDQAEARGDQMPCVSYERIAGTKIE